MPDASIRRLIDALRNDYPRRITPYATAFERAEEEHGFSWQIHGVPAIFSAITFDGTLPAETYDVHVESDPPGDYIFTGQYSLDELLQLVRRYFGPEADWPGMTS
jgi:hypothetical protein